MVVSGVTFILLANPKGHFCTATDGPTIVRSSRGLIRVVSGATCIHPALCAHSELDIG